MTERDRGLASGNGVGLLVPDEPLPPYAFVPGRFPHPISDPQGHSFGQEAARPEPLEPQRWQRSRHYLRGVDLFNAGFYWEAHETWEALWHAAGRTGTTADFLKGLIKLTAAGVKVRQGMPRGVAAHAAGAADLFRQTESALGGGDVRYCGLRLAELLANTVQAAATPAFAPETELPPVQIVFPFVLRPEPWPGE